MSMHAKLTCGCGKLLDDPESKLCRSCRETVAASLPRVELICPECKRHHVDSGAWAMRVHLTHLCEFCGHKWYVDPPVFGAAEGPTSTEVVKATLEVRDNLSREFRAPETSDTDMGLGDDDVQALALALAELSLRRPGWLDYLRGIAQHFDADLLFAQFRSTSADAVPEAPDSPLVSRVEQLERTIENVRAYVAEAGPSAMLWSHVRTLLTQDGYDVPIFDVPTDEMAPERPKADVKVPVPASRLDTLLVTLCAELEDQQRLAPDLSFMAPTGWDTPCNRDVAKTVRALYEAVRSGVRAQPSGRVWEGREFGRIRSICCDALAYTVVTDRTGDPRPATPAEAIEAVQLLVARLGHSESRRSHELNRRSAVMLEVARLTRVNGELLKYAQHLPTCAYRLSAGPASDLGMSPNPCDCGINAFKSSLETIEQSDSGIESVAIPPAVVPPEVKSGDEGSPKPPEAPRNEP